MQNCRSVPILVPNKQPTICNKYNTSNLKFSEVLGTKSANSSNFIRPISYKKKSTSYKLDHTKSPLSINLYILSYYTAHQKHPIKVTL